MIIKLQQNKQNTKRDTMDTQYVYIYLTHCSFDSYKIKSLVYFSDFQHVTVAWQFKIRKCTAVIYDIFVISFEQFYEKTN